MNATMRMSTTSSHENWETWMVEAKWPTTLGRLSPDGVAHARHVHHLANVVDAHHVGAAQDAGGHRRGGAHEPLRGRPLQHLSAEALAGRAREHRALQTGQLGQPAHDLQRMGGQLGEAEARMYSRLLAADARLMRPRQRLAQLGG